MSFTNNYLYHNLLINPTSFITYPVFEHQSNKRNKTSFSKSKFQSEKLSYKGEINNKSKSKIIRCVNVLYDISSEKKFYNKAQKKYNRFKLNFITLTLSAAQMGVKDEIIKKECLEWWLSLARRKFGMKHYIWKAERQKNGNLHFHITTNIFIGVQELRDSWNNAQDRIGFLDLFENKWNHRNPNSTDIKIVRNSKDLGIYIAKYISKEIGKENRISGKLWDCSESLKRVKKCSVELVCKLEDEFNVILQNYDFKKIEKDYIDIFVSEKLRVKEILTNNLSYEYNKYLQEVRDFKRNNKSNKSNMANRKPTEKKIVKKSNSNEYKRNKKNNRLPDKRQIALLNSWGRIIEV